MTNVLSKEKTLKVLVVNIYNQNSTHIHLPITDEEMKAFWKTFNPGENDCEVQGVDVLTSLNDHLTNEHEAALRQLHNCNLETINKVATILQDNAEFAFLMEGCERYEYAYDVFTNKKYTIFTNIESDEDLGLAWAKHHEWFKNLRHPELELYFNAGECGSTLRDANEVIYDVGHNKALHIHRPN